MINRINVETLTNSLLAVGVPRRIAEEAARNIARDGESRAAADILFSYFKKGRGRPPKQIVLNQDGTTQPVSSLIKRKIKPAKRREVK